MKQYSSEVIEEERSAKMQQAGEGVLKNKEVAQSYKPQVSFPQRLQKAKLEE